VATTAHQCSGKCKTFKSICEQYWYSQQTELRRVQGEWEHTDMKYREANQRWHDGKDAIKELKAVINSSNITVNDLRDQLHSATAANNKFKDQITNVEEEAHLVEIAFEIVKISNNELDKENAELLLALKAINRELNVNETSDDAIARATVLKVGRMATEALEKTYSDFFSGKNVQKSES